MDSHRGPVERIVGRLRQYVILRTEADNDSKLHDLMLDAADEIERLRNGIKAIDHMLRTEANTGEALWRLETMLAELMVPPNMKIQAYRCTWDGDTRGWMQYHDHTDPLPDEWDDEPPDEVAALVLKIDADIEIERLREALKKANEQAEHFEREWYLRGDALERAADVARNACEGWNDALMHEGAKMAADAVQALLVPNAAFSGPGTTDSQNSETPGPGSAATHS
jgi:hypothetical protein